MFFHKHKKVEPKTTNDPDKQKRDHHRKLVNATVDEMEHNEWKNHSGAG